MSVRHDHLLSEFRRKLQILISRGLNDPRIRGLVSVTEVKLSDDITEARVFISVLPQEHAKLTLEGLRSASHKLLNDLAPSIRMRRLPKLRFELDDSLKKQAALYAAIGESQPDSATEPVADSATAVSAPGSTCSSPSEESSP
jgi:ribosome-binding factor A